MVSMTLTIRVCVCRGKVMLPVHDSWLCLSYRNYADKDPNFMHERLWVSNAGF